MNIVFWNVERLGQSTPDDAKTLIADVVEWFFDDKDVELVVLCEITSGTTATASTGGELIVEKVGQVKKRRKRLESAQLGYSVISKNSDSPQASVINVPNYEDVFKLPNYKKAGQVFKDFSKRGVLELQTLCDNTDVYFYHVNSSLRSSYLVGWVSEFLRQRTSEHGYPFVLIGDMNCSPNDVKIELMYYDDSKLKGAGWSDKFEVHASGATHHARKGATKVLDFAVGNKGKAVTLSSIDTLHFSKFPGTYTDHPDHFPIMLKVA
ncbi:MAG: hypothetical protein EOP38_22955 [Rubrivivax sp.]|nr:MAG: hypothetical protein EOP38_22955 [Rubrivivax sp.]